MQDLIEKIKIMNEIISIFVLIAALIVCYLVYKKDFRMWNQLDMRDKYYALRGPSLIVFVLILLVLKLFGFIKG